MYLSTEWWICPVIQRPHGYHVEVSVDVQRLLTSTSSPSQSAYDIGARKTLSQRRKNRQLVGWDIYVLDAISELRQGITNEVGALWVVPAWWVRRVKLDQGRKEVPALRQ